MADARNWIIDHAGVGVSDIHRSAGFYADALRPLGIKIVMLPCWQAELTMARPACDRVAIRPATMLHSFSIRMATTSRLCFEGDRLV